MKKGISVILTLFFAFATVTADPVIKYDIGGNAGLSISGIITIPTGFIIVSYDGNVVPGPNTTLLVFNASAAGFQLVDNYTLLTSCESKIFLNAGGVFLSCKPLVGTTAEFYSFAVSSSGKLTLLRQFNAPANTIVLGDPQQQGNTYPIYWIATIPRSSRRSVQVSIWVISPLFDNFTLLTSNMFEIPDLEHSYFTLIGVSPPGDQLFVNFENRTLARYLFVFDTTTWQQVGNVGPRGGVIISNGVYILATQNTTSTTLQYQIFILGGSVTLLLFLVHRSSPRRCRQRSWHNMSCSSTSALSKHAVRLSRTYI